MNPLAFYAAIGLLVLAAIYMFRRRSANTKVSTLMFFSNVKRPAKGGQKLTRPQTPLILLLELLILSLLIVAAADPRAVSSNKLVPLIIVLDDSCSMKAGKNSNARQRAIEFLDSNIFKRKIYRISLIKAGVRPEFLGRRDMHHLEARQWLQNWTCYAANADINRAIQLAAESFRQNIPIMVLTDKKNEQKTGENIIWNAFGQPMANLAITDASRYALGDSDRCLVEFSNFATAAIRLKAEVIDKSQNALLDSISIKMGPGAVRRVRFNLEQTASTLQIVVKNDDAGFDNTLWLLPVRKPPVRVMIENMPAFQRRLLKKTVNSAENARLVDSKPQIVFTRAQQSQIADFEAWQFNFQIATEPVLLQGNIAVDRSHPLCQGLPPVEARWAIDAGNSSEGYPILSIGDINLLSLIKTVSGRTKLVMNYTPDYSSLHQDNFWPVFFWNLFDWRQKSIVGPVETNFRSGMQAKLNLDLSTEKIVIQRPDQTRTSIPVWGGEASVNLNQTGIYNLKADGRLWQLAANLVSSSESDLRKLHTSKQISDIKTSHLLKHSKDVRWWTLLPAVLLLLLHQWLLSRRRQSYVY
jgi:hypothetical protein